MLERQAYERYPESFKLEVLNFYYSHGEDRKTTLLEYGIDHSCLRDWLRKYESQEKALSLYSKCQKDMQKKLRKLPSDSKLAQAEYERLQRELEESQMRAKGLEVMLELAEKEYGIKLKKNFGVRR